MPESKRDTTLGHRPRWMFPVLALFLAFSLVLVTDVSMTAIGLVPPQDPLLLYRSTYEQEFSPFVEVVDGTISIRADWVNSGEVLRVTSGVREGQYITHPGFRPSRFAKVKAPGTLRVFALGGSTTYGLYAGQKSAFPNIIEERLKSLAPDQPIEVINLGCASWASDRVSNVVDSLLGLEPDLVIIYTGHNELLKGRADAAAEMEEIGGLRTFFLENSALFGWINHAYSRFSNAKEHELIREEVAAIKAGRMLVYDPTAAPPALRKAFLRAAIPKYRANIERIIQKTRANSIPLLLLLPVGNLLQEPKAPGHGVSFNSEEEFDRYMLEGLSHWDLDDWSGALRKFDRAIALSPEYATAHYFRGAALKKLERFSESRAAYQRALDSDNWTHRMNSELEDVLISVANTNDVTWIDLRPSFFDELLNERILELFHDHVHPTALGHSIIADLALPEIARLLDLSPPSGVTNLTPPRCRR